MPRNLRQPRPAGDPTNPPINLNDLQKDSFPGSTIEVHDPPPGNMATQDAFDEGKGIKAPPGARGEYTERPPGNTGGPGGSIGVDPLKYKVDYEDHKRNQIPPMFLPAAAKIREEIEDEDEPEDEQDSTFERGLLQPEQESVHPDAGDATPDVVTPPGGGSADVPSGGTPEVPHAAPLPLDRLNNPDEGVRAAIYGVTGSINPGMDTTQQLKFYNLDPLIQNPGITEKMLADLGYRVETFSYNPERFRLPKLKMQGYDKGTVWIYDPEEEHGSFKDKEYTRAWRVFHEVGHGVTEDFMQQRYGASKREGRLGAESTSMRGVPPKQVQVTVRPLTLMEAQRAVEWEDTAFRAQQMLLSMYGVQISPQDFAKEYNVNIADALYRVMTGDFGDPGEYGYVPGDKPADLRGLLELLQAQEAEIAREQGRQPTAGVDLSTWSPIPDEAIRQSLEKRMHQRAARRLAFNVYPVPSEPRQLDERLLLQIPHDVQERYTDLTRRVKEYVNNLKLNTLDMYSFPSDPPEKWVEEERLNVPVDWEDHDAWSAYMGRLSHDDLADWIGLEALDGGRISSLAPDLFTQHALETGGATDFNSWFRSRSPAIKDRNLLDYVRQTARAFPNDGLGRGYSGFWRKRNQGMVREQATQKAKDRHDRFLREHDYGNHVKPNYKKSFDDVVRSRSEHMPLSEVVNSLHSLPVEGTDRETVDEFRTEYDSLVNEGMHALDLYREPVSRDDRLYGDMQYEGEKWVPTRRIVSREMVSKESVDYKPATGDRRCSTCVMYDDHSCTLVKGEISPDAVCEEWYSKEKDASHLPVALYRYGDHYFLVHEADAAQIASQSIMVRAHVYNIVPGSSITKIANANWTEKTRALAAAIREVQAGTDKEAVLMKYGRAYGPGLRKAVSDYTWLTSNKKGDGGGGPPGSTFGDSTCSSFEQQSPDACNGCTFAPNMGGLEPGYGDNGCMLTHLFLNAPDSGFGRGDQDHTRTPVTPGVQKPRRPQLYR